MLDGVSEGAASSRIPENLRRFLTFPHGRGDLRKLGDERADSLTEIRSATEELCWPAALK